ncbi:hypothetical protein T11_18341 [Trichinella zimbabwensis]|uniref:Uncharacterized protein n=1 Tax=Trichinella zimbabwensis TaxID=268475 RepID=A0A0V1G821_9BILA|nr:hypothetical protein T11_18341 [Trichinella zimbabwensis]
MTCNRYMPNGSKFRCPLTNFFIPALSCPLIPVDDYFPNFLKYDQRAKT